MPQSLSLVEALANKLGNGFQWNGYDGRWRNRSLSYILYVGMTLYKQ